MQRYFIKLAYNGKPFNGWQIQPNAPSVQKELEENLSKILRVKTSVVGCGRTDSGVHASKYYAHFETNHILDFPSLIFKLNCMISREISIFDIFSVHENVHARFSAVTRTYKYYINQIKDAFQFEQSWFMHASLDVDKMNEACKLLIGTQDFTSFSKLHTQTRTNICTVKEASWKQVNHSFIFTITADRYLHNMVRAIVGTTIEVGKGKINADQFKDIITAKDRQRAGGSVPGHGLFLANITYPDFQ